MKYLALLGLLFSMNSVFARDIVIKGLEAKAVMDTLSSNEKLSVFQDGGMGKRYVFIDVINCSKSTVVGKEIQVCAFNTIINEKPVSVTLFSDEDNSSLEEIRYVLASVTNAEKNVNSQRKELSIKSLTCKQSGVGHVLDDIAIELRYECKITL